MIRRDAGRAVGHQYAIYTWSRITGQERCIGTYDSLEEAEAEADRAGGRVADMGKSDPFGSSVDGSAYVSRKYRKRTGLGASDDWLEEW